MRNQRIDSKLWGQRCEKTLDQQRLQTFCRSRKEASPPFFWFLAALSAALVVLGCSSDARRKHVRVPDWEIDPVPTAHETVMAGPQSGSTEPTKSESLVTNHSTMSGTAAPGSVADENWVALDRWCHSKGLEPATRVPEVPLPMYVLHTTNGVLTLRAGRQSAEWDRTELRLGFAPQSINGAPFVHALDLRKSIEPLLLARSFTLAKTNDIIVIDPGHGGENAGTRSVLGNGFEKEFTLDWARRLQRRLLTNGWQVFLTRTNDIDLALSNRVALANEHKAGLFLSLHFNWAESDQAQAGLETYCLTPAGMTSSVTRGYPDNPSQAFPNNAFDESNLLVALRIHRALLQLNGHRDRGVRRARFMGVLRGQQRPAVLVEGGYLSNPREARLISEPEYRQKLAEAVANALE